MGHGPGEAGLPAIVIEERIPSTLQDVRESLARIVEALAERGLAEERCATLELVLAEAMTNIVKHAYGEQPEGWLTLQLSVNPCCVACRLEDGGVAMPGLELPPGIPQSFSDEIQDLPEGGFGWFLIRELTHNLVYSRLDERNQLTFWLEAGS